MHEDPSLNPDTLLHRARRFREFGELIAAKDTLLMAINGDPCFAKAWSLLGEVYEELGNLKKAQECYKTAFSKDTDWSDPLANLGLLEFSQKLYQDAVKTLKMYAELGGNDINVLLTLARSAFKLEDCKTVIAVTSQIIEMNEDIYEAWELRGFCHAKMSNYSSALVSLNLALELDPRSITALNGVGDLCYESRNYEGAVSFYLPSVAKRKKQSKVLFRLGTSLWFLGRWSDAILYLEEYTKLVPEDANGWNNLGVVLREKGEVTRSLECYKHALKFNPALEVAKKNMNTAMNKEVIL